MGPTAARQNSVLDAHGERGGTCQSFWLTCFKIAVVGVYVVLFASLVGRLAVAHWTMSAGLLFVPGVLAGYLCVDFVSGFAHWFCDTFFDEETPVIGAALIAPFRDHHRNPGAITSYRFLEQDSSNYSIVLPALFYSWWIEGPVAGSLVSFMGHSFLFSFGFFAMGVNLFHKWAHAERVPFGVRRLQSCGVILSPRHHDIHHRGNYSKGFCVATGWMNRVLDPIGFFPGVERVIRSVMLGKRNQS